jgi:hypothetical protein
MASLTNNPVNQFAQWVGLSAEILRFPTPTVGQLTQKHFSAGNSQLFDVRMAKLYDQCLATQPFDINQADKLGLTLTKTTYTGILPPPGVPNPSYIATMILESWGGGRYTFQLTCDATTGILHGTVNGDTHVAIAVGQAFSPPR